MTLGKEDRAWRAVGAGCFGALLGVLLGLSVTPVVSVAVTAGFALVGGVVGFAANKRSDGGEGAGPSKPSGLLVAALSAGCIAGIGVGVYARTHRLLEPSLHARMAELSETGLGQEAARELVLLERFGSTAGPVVADERIRGANALVEALVDAGFSEERAREIVGARLGSAAEQPAASDAETIDSGSGVLFAMSEEDKSKCEERAEIVFESEEQMQTSLGDFEDVRVRSIPARVDTLGLGAAEKLVVARAMLTLACDFGATDED